MKPASELSVLMLAEYYHSKLPQLFVEHKKVGLKVGDWFLTEDVELILHANHTKSLRYMIFRIDVYVFQVHECLMFKHQLFSYL